MKRDLEVIVKNFPPYPPNSEERVKLLRSYAGLRAEIDRLTVPPEVTAQTIAQRKELEASLSNDYTFVLGQNGTNKTVLKADVHYGPTGIYIPELVPPETVDDRSIGQALQQLDTAGQLIQARREALQAQGVTIGESMYNQMMTERSAEASSVNIRQDLATQPVGITREGTTKLDQLMGNTWP
jgi:hypothetical protein